MTKTDHLLKTAQTLFDLAVSDSATADQRRVAYAAHQRFCRHNGLNAYGFLFDHAMQIEHRSNLQVVERSK